MIHACHDCTDGAADFMMDVIAGQLPAEYKAAHPDFSPDSLFASWERFRRTPSNHEARRASSSGA
jgi:hypothetical protein